MDANELWEILNKAPYNEVRGMIEAYRMVGLDIRLLGESGPNIIYKWINYAYKGDSYYIDERKRSPHA